MRRLQTATFVGRTEDGARFALEDQWECRIYVLQDDLVRVLFTPSEGSREPRTWSIVAGGTDVPWTGRDRLDTSGFARPRFSLTLTEAHVAIATSVLNVSVRLAPFGLDWTLGNGKPLASDRATNGYQWRRSTATLRHYMTR